jgi:hypothetical protein
MKINDPLTLVCTGIVEYIGPRKSNKTQPQPFDQRNKTRFLIDKVSTVLRYIELTKGITHFSNLIHRHRPECGISKESNPFAKSGHTTGVPVAFKGVPLFSCRIRMRK